MTPDPLAGQVQLLGPGAGMHQAALEMLDAVQVGGVRRREQTQTGDKEAGPVGDAAVGADGPGAGDLVELGLGHAGFERGCAHAGRSGPPRR